MDVGRALGISSGLALANLGSHRRHLSWSLGCQSTSWCLAVDSILELGIVPQHLNVTEACYMLVWYCTWELSLDPALSSEVCHQLRPGGI